jgi:phenylacetate-CoA ligase
MGIEDWGYRWLKRYMDAPQWVKEPLGRLYSLLPDRWRHGKDFARFRDEASLTDPAEIQRLSESRLRETLTWAIKTVPAYAALAAQLLIDMPLSELLALFPLMTKLDYKRNPEAYLSTACSDAERLPMQTSGSVAEPFKFALQKGVTRSKESAYIEAFSRRIGLTRQDVVLSLRGRNIRGAAADNGPLHSYEPIKRMLWISPNHLDAAYMPGHVDAAIRYGVNFIQGYSSAVYELARWLEFNPVPRFTQAVRGVQLFSESADEGMVALIEKVFGCPVLVHYGHSERSVMAGSMPDDHRYFVWPLYGHVELVDEAGQPITEPGVQGEVVATGFDNKAMPFIRYRTGDLAMWSDRAPHPALPGYPVLERIDGRSNDYFVARDGRRIPVASLGGLRPPAFLKVEATQYEQHEPGRITVRLQSAEPLDPAVLTVIDDYFRTKLLGLVEAELQVVPHIERTARGKRRLMIQHLTERSAETHARN